MTRIIPNEGDTGLTPQQRFRQQQPGRVAEIRAKHRAAAKAQPKANSEVDWYMRTRFGMNLDDYNQMLADQGGGCAVCGKLPKQRRHHIDHDHATGEVRGLLCHQCNLALGCVGDDVDRLMGLAAYLVSAQDVLCALEGCPK